VQGDDAAGLGGRVQGGGKMSIKDTILSKKTYFLLATGFKLLCQKKKFNKQL